MVVFESELEGSDNVSQNLAVERATREKVQFSLWRFHSLH
jgi:hypothetical protein